MAEDPNDPRWLLYQEMIDKNAAPPGAAADIERGVVAGILKLNTDAGLANSQIGRMKANYLSKNFSADDAMRAVGRGAIGIGPYLDEADAAFNATMAPVVDPMLPDTYDKLPEANWPDRYAHALDLQRAKDRYSKAQNPGTNAALEFGGTAASALAMLAAGGGTLLGGSSAEAPLLEQTLRSGAAGGGWGAVGGYGAGEGDWRNRLSTALAGGATGAVLGAAMPSVARGAAWGAQKLGNAGRRLGGLFGLTDAPPPAPSAAELAVARAAARGGITAKTAADAPEGSMLMDLSENTRDMAGALSGIPGKGQEKVIGAVKQRTSELPELIDRTTTAALGPGWNVKKTVEDLDQLAWKQAEPFYEKFRSYPMTIDDELQGILNRDAAQRAIPKAIARMSNHGKVFSLEDPALITDSLDNIKQVMSLMSRSTTEDNAAREGFTAVGTKLRDAIAARNPFAKDAWKAYAGPKEIADAMEAGMNVFDVSKSKIVRPEELLDMQKAMSPGAWEAYKIGARSSLDDIMGTTKKGGADEMVRKLINAGYNREKMAALFGVDAAVKVTKMLEGASNWVATSGKVGAGAKTQSMLAAEQSLGLGGPGKIEQLATTNLTAPLEPVAKIANWARAGMKENKYNQIGSEVADMLTSQSGMGRDTLAPVVERLMSITKNQGASLAQRQAIARLVRALLTPSVTSAASRTGSAFAPQHWEDQ